MSKTMTQVGDLLQSEGSRVAEWVLQQEQVPYEVRQAALSIESGVRDWTDVRLAINRADGEDR